MPIVASITKSARTVTAPGDTAKEIQHAVTTAMTPHRGPVFVDFPMDVIFGSATAPECRTARCHAASIPTPRTSSALAALIAAAERPAIIVGSDVYWEGAWPALAPLRRDDAGAVLVQRPRSRVPAGRPRARVHADPRPAEDRRRSRGGHRHPARLPPRVRSLRRRAGRAHLSTRPRAGPRTSRRRPSPAGDLTTILDGMTAWSGGAAPITSPGSRRCATPSRPPRRPSALLLDAGGDPIKPTRVYGELGKRLARDAVVICDGGDFVSYAGKYVEVYTPGCWLDTGPYGCLGNGPGYAIAARVAHPDAQIVVMLGDGAAGFSLMDVDTLVRHDLPVVMVVGNNGMLGPREVPDAGDLRLRRRVRPAARVSLRRGREGARRRGRDRAHARRGRPRARPCVRGGRALPRQRDDRSRPTSTRGRRTSGRRTERRSAPLGCAKHRLSSAARVAG